MKSSTVGKQLAWVIAALCAAAAPVLADQSEELAGGDGGNLHLIVNGAKFCSFTPFAANVNWERFFTKPVPAPTAAPGAVAAPDAPFPFVIGMYKPIDGNLQVTGKDGVVHATWTFSAKDEVHFEALAIAGEFQLPQLSGGSWTADAAQGAFPAIFAGSHLFNGSAKSFTMTFPDQHVVKFAFAQPTAITVQDNRQWGDASFSIRFGDLASKLTANETYTLQADITTPEGLAYSRELPDFMKPVQLQANDQWIPLKEELDIVPGSALDLTSLGFTDGPCGAKGRIIVTPDGHFACADEPNKPRRFYGVNFCFDSSYMAKDKCDQALDRIVRLGYNSIRIHHYERFLTKPENAPGFDWDPVKVDQLDYFIAGCGKRGIWITTDLFVSRPIYGKQIGQAQEQLDMNRYKVLIPVSEPAWQDWATFSRHLLDHVNPYTKVRLADDPTIAWISLINEGPVASTWGEVSQLPEWKTAWNKWLAQRFPTRDALLASLPDLAAGEDPNTNSVPLPSGPAKTTPRGRLCEVFVAEMETANFVRSRDFLRNEVKCQALLTNMNNSGPEVIPLVGTRDHYDYVDEHFYVDGPVFIEKAWSLPSYSANANPLASGASGSSAVASVRLYRKPYTISEYDYSGPGRFRGVGGILTGTLASLQDWDCLWRFDYSWTNRIIFEPSTMGYFDVVSDPLNQAADRLAAILFLRHDVTTAPSRLAMIIPRGVLDHPTDKLDLTAIQSAVWTTRIGSLLVDDAAKVPAGYIPVPIDQGSDTAAILTALGTIKPPVTLPSDKLIRSETGQVSILPDQSLLTVDTPMSAGGYADPGKAIDAANAGVKIDGLTTGASVFVNSLDASPIKNSQHLLVTHLTDLQNSNTRYGEGAQQTLLSYGNLPHIVRNGSATIHITLDKPEAYTVWGLSVGGRRVEKVPSQVVSGQLVFTASVRGSEGARMLYEIAR